MKHPSNLAERRHERLRTIMHRRFLRVNSAGWPWAEKTWARYSKWNGNCGSIRCHELKYFSHRRKRREALKRAWIEEEKSGYYLGRPPSFCVPRRPSLRRTAT